MLVERQPLFHAIFMTKKRSGFGEPRNLKGGAHVPPGDCSELAMADTEMGPLGFTQSCLQR